MGLDMYLNAERFLWHEEREKLQAPLASLASDLGFGFAEIKEVTFEAAYWRKANHIHNWFVTNVQGGVDECQKTPVSLEQLVELLRVVTKVLEDPETLGPTMLPTQSGFFFGSKEYDEGYVEDLRYTRDRLYEILSNPEAKKFDFYYRASW
jgi:hypothetical protein